MKNSVRQITEDENDTPSEVNRLTSSMSRAPVGGASFYLHPGQLFVTREPMQITTIVGSCVALCLWDRRSGVGGMNHYLLPYWSTNTNASTRFGNVAIEHLIREILALGGSKENLQGKLFGGACINQALKAKYMDLGSKNVEVALDLLSSEGIPIVAKDVGGESGRKIIFDTFGGIVFVKRL